MQKTTFEINFGTSECSARTPYPAWAVPGCPLVVSRPIDHAHARETGKPRPSTQRNAGWRISHGGLGMAVSDCFDTRAAAYAFAVAVSDAPWDEIDTNPKTAAYRACKARWDAVKEVMLRRDR